jgi:hypothetical protein
MKVKELIDILGKLNKDAEVVLSSDGEGNNFSPLAEYGEGVYFPDTTWSGEFLDPKEDADYISECKENGDDLVDAIVLWPIN